MTYTSLAAMTMWRGSRWKGWYMHQEWMKGPSVLPEGRVFEANYIECSGAHEERKILIEAIENWLHPHREARKFDELD